MKSFRYPPGRIHLLRLDTDSDLSDSITAYAEQHGITVGWVNFLGAVRHASLRYYDQEAKRYEDFVVDEPLEVVAGVGNISLLDGRPFIHIHAALTDEAGHGRGGHVNGGTVVFAMEVIIQELDGVPPSRELDDCTGLTLW